MRDGEARTKVQTGVLVGARPRSRWRLEDADPGAGEQKDGSESWRLCPLQILMEKVIFDQKVLDLTRNGG